MTTAPTSTRDGKYFAGGATAITSFMLLSWLFDEPRTTITLSLVASISVAGYLLFATLKEFDKCYRLCMIVFLLGMIYWFYWPGFLDGLSTEGYIYTASRMIVAEHAASYAAMLINIFFASFMAAYGLSLPPNSVTTFISKALGSSRETPSTKKLQIATVLLALTGLIIYFALSQGYAQAFRYILASRSADKPWSSEGNYGTSLTPFHHLAQSILINSAIFAQIYICLCKGSRIGKGCMLLLVLFITLVVGIGSGTRSIVLLILVPVFLVYYTSNLRRGWSIKRDIIVGIFLLITLITANYQLQVRTSGVQRNADVDMLNTFQDNNFFKETSFAVWVADKEDYTYDTVLLDILTGPIPRILWPEKPTMKDVEVYSYYRSGVDITKTGGNALPSIVGQYLISWGLLGVIEIGLILGFLLKIVDAILTRHSGVLLQISCSFFAVYIFASFRHIAFGYFFPFAMYLILIRICFKKASDLKHKPPTTSHRLRHIDQAGYRTKKTTIPDERVNPPQQQTERR